MRQGWRTGVVALVGVAVSSCVAEEVPIATTTQALTAEQCDYFQEGGKVTICHATQASVVVIRVAQQACVQAHSDHPGDFVAADGDCGPGACLAQGSPCDATLPCCDGAACTNGVCTPVDLCAGVSCSATDVCKTASCDPGTGACVESNADDGTPCDDGDAATEGDACRSGTCIGTQPPQTEFLWEVSTDGGATWAPVTLPNTSWGCSFCSRLYRTYVTGVPQSVSFRYGSDNEARMFVNGAVVFDDYYVNGVDWCTTASCCSECCDTFVNCTNVVNAQAPFSLSAGDLATFSAGTNEIRWQVNQQSGGSGFHTLMTVAY